MMLLMVVLGMAWHCVGNDCPDGPVKLNVTRPKLLQSSRPKQPSSLEIRKSLPQPTSR